MRVLVVTVVHTPLDARIHHRQIRALIAAGHEVTYAAPWRATATPVSAVADGVSVVDLPRAAGRRRVAARTAAGRLLRQLAPVHDVVLLHDPELLTVVGRRRHRATPVVLDVHEDLAASLGDRAWLPSALRAPAASMARRLERWAESRVTLLLAEASYAERFRHPHPVVPNLPWLPVDPPAAGTARRVVHLGRISVGRGAHELLAVGARLAASGGPPLHLVGPADADVAAGVRAAHARGEVVWHDFLPNDAALEVVRGSVAGLALLHDLPNYRGSLPTKIVEYLAHRVPAVTTPLPEARRIVEDAGAGIVVDHGDVDAVVAAVDELDTDLHRRTALGDAGHAHVAAHASWDAAAGAFVDHLEAAAGRR